MKKRHLMRNWFSQRVMLLWTMDALEKTLEKTMMKTMKTNSICYLLRNLSTAILLRAATVRIVKRPIRLKEERKPILQTTKKPWQKWVGSASVHCDTESQMIHTIVREAMPNSSMVSGRFSARHLIQYEGFQPVLSRTQSRCNKFDVQ